MKKFYFLLLSFCCFSFLIDAQPSTIQIRLLDEYYIQNANALKPGLNFMIITSRKQFIKLFGKVNKADTPDFSKEDALVMALPAQHQEPKLSFEKTATKAGQFMEVYCSVVAGKGTVSYLYYPIAVGVIPRLQDLIKIDFYNRQNMQIMESVPIRRRKGE